MKRIQKITVIMTLAAAVGLVMAKRAQEKTAAHGPVPAVADASRPLPRLVDLGAGTCIPCKAMAPILEELRTEYAETFQVAFIDVWEDPPAAEPYRINLIPTQIFFDASGNELWRHEGFLGKEEILAKWKELGVAM
jgi:thioredoxin 1